MKIFALNLCLEFELRNNLSTYQFDLITFEELMGHFFKGPEFSGQKFYVEVNADKETFLSEVMDIQKNEEWRQLDATVCFVFRSGEKLESYLDDFKDKFRHVDAAGGLVVDEKGRYLCIYNRGRWTLPKGHVEWREPEEDAAVREVKEETGLEEVTLKEKLGKTYHTFRKGKKWIIKTTHWYKMTATSDQKLVPQEDEDILAVAWKDKEEWLSVSTESYPLTRYLFEKEFAGNLNVAKQ